MSKEIDCDDCDSSGSCEECSGVGDILGSDDWIECEYCDGSGICETCTGEGTIDEF